MAESKSYAQLSAELHKIMEDLESGDLDIDEAVSCYERGLKLVGELENHLKRAENKVTELKARLLDEEEE